MTFELESTLICFSFVLHAFMTKKTQLS